MSLFKKFKYSNFIVASLSLIIFSFFLFSKSYPNWIFVVYLILVLFFFLLNLNFKNKFSISRYKQDLIITMGLFTLSFLLYLFRIAEITPGVWGDEIAIGLMADKLLQLNSFTPFIPDNLGHSTPLIYLSSLIISILGKSIFSLRIVSVIFGALSVSAFYILLRQSFDKKISLSGGVLLSTSYILIIVSRFAYEMSAAIFFLILSLLIYFNFYNKPSKEKSILLGAVLGIGLYTYLSFRSIIPIFIIAVLSVLFIKTKQKFKYLFFFIFSFFIILIPIISYSINYPILINERLTSLNIFLQNLPAGELIKELQSASFRTLTMFFITGDPNIRQNPAGVTPIDPITSFLFILGLIGLLFHRKHIAIIIISLIFIILLSEIITLEKIPEFHYYGLGHPNTLRISLIIPLVILSASWVINFIVNKISNKNYQIIFLIILVSILSFYNLNNYYSQKISPWIYATNFVIPLKIVNYINQQNMQNVGLSTNFYENQHVKYFLNPKIKTFKAKVPLKCELNKLTYKISFISIKDLISSCTQVEINKLQLNTEFVIYPISNPWGKVDGIIVSKY